MAPWAPAKPNCLPTRTGLLHGQGRMVGSETRKLTVSYSQPRTSNPLGHLPTQRASRVTCLSNGCFNTGVPITRCTGCLWSLHPDPSILGQGRLSQLCQPYGTGTSP